MIITVLHCSETLKRGGKGETGRGKREEKGAWDGGASAALEMGWGVGGQIK